MTAEPTLNVNDTLPVESPARFYADAVARGAGFEGQLDDAFQARLAADFAGMEAAQCDFYHTMDLGGGEVHPGVWDLRGRERSYLGFVDVAGLRVLEIGTASGHLAFHMEK